MKNYATFKDLEDTSVFITGGGSGIGASITEGFLSQGAKVTFVQRSDCDDFLDHVSSKYKHKPLFIKCDNVSHKLSSLLSFINFKPFLSMASLCLPRAIIEISALVFFKLHAR